VIEKKKTFLILKGEDLQNMPFLDHPDVGIIKNVKATIIDMFQEIKENILEKNGKIQF
jgi:hypothetical protein